MVRAAHFAGICAIALTSSALAQQTATPPAQQPPIDVTGQRPPPPKEKLICKDENTGRLIPTRVCRTKAEWQQAEDDGQQTLDVLRDNQRVRCGGLMC